MSKALIHFGGLTAAHKKRMPPKNGDTLIVNHYGLFLKTIATAENNASIREANKAQWPCLANAALLDDLFS